MWIQIQPQAQCCHSLQTQTHTARSIHLPRLQTSFQRPHLQGQPLKIRSWHFNKGTHSFKTLHLAKIITITLTETLSLIIYIFLFLSSDAHAVIRKYQGLHHCMICGYKSNRSYNAVTHYKLKHAPQVPSTCQICNQVFRNPIFRDNHLKQVHGISKGLMKAGVPFNFS